LFLRPNTDRTRRQSYKGARVIDLQTERLVSLAEAAKLVPPGRQGKSTHVGTLLRWVLKGCRAPNGGKVKLEAIRLGGKWATSSEALQRFADRLTPRLDEPPPVIRSFTARQRASKRAEKALIEAGF
jgi:hypothetical protein